MANPSPKLTNLLVQAFWIDANYKVVEQGLKVVGNDIFSKVVYKDFEDVEGQLFAKDGELPDIFMRKAWSKPVWGVLLVGGLSLLLANLFNLTAIAILGSGGFLLIFAAVNAANVKLRKTTGGNLFISGLGFLTCIIALGVLFYHTYEDNPHSLWTLLGIIGLSILFEIIYPKIAHRKLILSATKAPRHKGRKRLFKAIK